MNCLISRTRIILLMTALYAVESETARPDTFVDPQTDETLTRELISDSGFERGCLLWEPKTGSHLEYGRIAGVGEKGTPVWGLAQWSSREKLPLDEPRTLASGALRYANPAKVVTFGSHDTTDADISLAVNGGFEYNGRVRQQGESWVHLLVEQHFENPPTLSELTQAHFHIAARLKSSRRLEMPGYSPHLHAAQNQIFFTIRNCNPTSAGNGQLLWFGVPLYDDRVRIPKAHQARDAGKGDASGMFIFTVDGGEFTAQSLHDNQWVTIDRDVLPLMRQGLTVAWQAGFLKESQSFADYRITSINLGWEVPGTFDVEMQYRDLSLKLTTRPESR